MTSYKKKQSKQTPLNEAKFVCIDCESTGLDPFQDKIIEIAVCSFSFEKNDESFESLIDPQCEIPQTSIEIHHITPDMVEGKPLIKDVLDKVEEIAKGRVIVGHNINFDIDLVKTAAEANNKTSTLKNSPSIDTLRLARLYAQSPSNSLEALRKHFNISEEGAHRAMSDVLVNIQVFRKLVHFGEYKTLEDILNILSKPIKMKKMPLGVHKGRPFKEVPVAYLRWAADKDFDNDLLFSIRSELKRRREKDSFEQASNPFGSIL